MYIFRSSRLLHSCKPLEDPCTGHPLHYTYHHFGKCQQISPSPKHIYRKQHPYSERSGEHEKNLKHLSQMPD